VNIIVNMTHMDKPELMPSEEMWRKFSTWTGVSEWVIVQTRSYRRAINIAKHCKRDSISRAICHAVGSGKTAALKDYANSNKNVFYMECEEYFTRRTFLSTLCQTMAIYSTAKSSIAEMVDQIVEKLNSINKPLLIIDEYDKLKDGILNFYKTFYNKTEGRAGFLICGAPHLQQKIIRGANLQKQAYQEIYSRLGGRFIELENANESDVRKICKANGVEDEGHIKAILSIEDIKVKMRTTGADLRQVKAAIEGLKLKLQNETNVD